MRNSADIARALEDIALLMQISGENTFKVRAYERGAQIVAELEDGLAPLIEEGRLREVEGIGPGLANQIGELWESGSSTLLTELQSALPPGTLELARLPGMTLRRLRALSEGLGVSSIEALHTACVEQRVRTLPGFGEKTEQRLQQAVERARAAASEPAAVAGKLRISEALRICDRVAQALVSQGEARAVLLAGAARRFEETPGELEVVVVSDDQAAVWKRLARLPWVTRVDSASSQARLVQGVPLVVHFTSAQQQGAALLFATGPASHLQALAARASERGLELDGRGLTSRADPRAIAASASEVEIYERLGLAFVPPELRASDRLLETSERGFAGLLTQEDIHGLVHCHTTYSDGKNSIEEMARAADALGMQYITITDHSPSAHYARGVTLDRLKEQWDEIARVQELVRVKILRGTESDILADGALDHPDAVLEQLDVVIASVHSRFKLDRARMTERLVRTMGLPLFKIWGHALGRMLLSRDPIDCDVPAVLDALASSRGAIELNADPHRLDLPPAWIPHARERGIPFVVSVDAHSTEGLDVLPLGIGMARRGGVRREEVLNTLPADEFAARVRPFA